MIRASDPCAPSHSLPLGEPAKTPEHIG